MQNSQEGKKEQNVTSHFTDGKRSHERFIAVHEITLEIWGRAQLQTASPEPVLGYLSMVLNAQGAK